MGREGRRERCVGAKGWPVLLFEDLSFLAGGWPALQQPLRVSPLPVGSFTEPITQLSPSKGETCILYRLRVEVGRSWVSGIWRPNVQTLAPLSRDHEGPQNHSLWELGGFPRVCGHPLGAVELRRGVKAVGVRELQVPSGAGHARGCRAASVLRILAQGLPWWSSS